LKQLATSAVGGVGFGAGLRFHNALQALMLIDVGLMQVLLLAAVL
jgi:hypothetical protein